MDERQFKILNEKLNRIIALLTIQNVRDKNDKIYLLKELGLSSNEIGHLIGIKNPRQMGGWKRK